MIRFTYPPDKDDLMMLSDIEIKKLIETLKKELKRRELVREQRRVNKPN